MNKILSIFLLFFSSSLFAGVGGSGGSGIIEISVEEMIVVSSAFAFGESIYITDLDMVVVPVEVNVETVISLDKDDNEITLVVVSPTSE